MSVCSEVQQLDNHAVRTCDTGHTKRESIFMEISLPRPEKGKRELEVLIIT